MTATAAQILQVRRMIAESTTTVYTDAMIQAYIEAQPIPDTDGLEPEDTGWVATYDLAAAAADIWDEKAASLACSFDFAADGGNFSASQLFDQAQKMARFWRAKRVARAHPVIISSGLKASNEY